MAVWGAGFVAGKIALGAAGGAEALPRSAAEVSETAFHGTHQHACARPLARDGPELRLHRPQDSALKPGANVELHVKREHLVLLGD